MDEPRHLPRHFHSLDALRGLAALSVVLFHWQHFFFTGSEKPASFASSRQPLYGLLRPFYEGGNQAVELFFCLSGFIFFWLYGQKIGRREVSFRRFALLRFSRLYPLHLLTLLLVAAGQTLFLTRHGSFFVYPYNDAPHFAGQLLFASDWGFQSRFSFNGPVWSVSIEVLLYALFYAACNRRLTRWWHLALFLPAGALLWPVNPDLSRGVMAFFAGGLTYYAVERLHRDGLPRRTLPWLVAATAVAWVVVPWLIFLDTPAELLRSLRDAGHPSVFGTPRAVGRAAALVEFLACNLLLFPLTVATLASVESRSGTLGTRLAFLGHLSYSSYLLHFPLQLGFVLLGPRFAPGSPFYASPVALVVYYGTLIPLSLGCYRYFERPAQALLRSRLLPTQ